MLADAERTPLMDFCLPPELEAHEPPEARGLKRDEVRLLVSHVEDDRLEHLRFTDLPSVLRSGDLLVANDSATLPAAVTAHRANGDALALHFSTQLEATLWVVEPRQTRVQQEERLGLPGKARAHMLAPYGDSKRLWVALIELSAGMSVPGYLGRYGRPITYDYVRGHWPLAAYQTVYADEPGSAEMPSAGRAFSPDVLERLSHGGVGFNTLTLHAGVASLEQHEQPYPERYRIPAATAQAVELAREQGRRVIAVGTTVVRALETAASRGDGRVAEHSGWTDLVITPERGVAVVNGLLTGFHEPRASHLGMLEAIANRGHLEIAYHAAVREKYLWHEFGDLHLILP